MKQRRKYFTERQRRRQRLERYERYEFDEERMGRLIVWVGFIGLITGMLVVLV